MSDFSLTAVIGADTSAFDSAMKNIIRQIQSVTQLQPAAPPAPPAIPSQVEDTNATLQQQAAATEAAARAWDDLGKSASKAMSGIIESLATEKGNPFQAILKLLGNAAKSLGAHLIEIGLPMFAVPGLQGEAALYEIGGAALEVIGAKLSAAKMASGGIVSSSIFANVGEYAGASHNPEVVAPLDKLKGMMGNNGGGNFRMSILSDTLTSFQDRAAQWDSMVTGNGNN